VRSTNDLRLTSGSGSEEYLEAEHLLPNVTVTCDLVLKNWTPTITFISFLRINWHLSAWRKAGIPWCPWNSMEFLHGHVHGSISGSGIRCLHIPKGKLQPLVVVCGDQNVTLSFYLQMRLKSEIDKQGGDRGAGVGSRSCPEGRCMADAIVQCWQWCSLSRCPVLCFDIPILEACQQTPKPASMMRPIEYKPHMPNRIQTSHADTRLPIQWHWVRWDWWSRTTKLLSWVSHDLFRTSSILNPQKATVNKHQNTIKASNS